MFDDGNNIAGVTASRRAVLRGAGALGASSLFACAALVSSRAAAFGSTAGPGAASAVLERNVEVRMRDGTILRADIYRPADLHSAPVLLQRTPYGKDSYAKVAQSFAAQGFVTIFQDVRGQFASDGVFEPWLNEGDDGYDTIEWAARLPGVTGKVGTMGASYAGACQWLTAVQRPPHLTAMICQVSPADFFDQWVFPGGAFALSFIETWLLRNVANSAAMRLKDGAQIQAAMANAYNDLTEHLYSHLPLRDFPPLFPERRDVAGYYFDWINRHPTRDEYWRRLSVRGRHNRITVPVLSFSGWYDVFLAGAIENFNGMQSNGATPEARRESRLVIGPWAHNGWGPKLGEIDFGDSAASPYMPMARAWFDRWLKGIEPEDKPATVKYFSMGADEWRSTSTWPPPGITYRSYYLQSEGRSNGSAGTGALAEAPSAVEGTDQFVYDPANPVPSVGGNGCCYAPASPIGPFDQRSVEARDDVLVYTSAPLAEPLDVTGAIAVELYAASSAPDTDFTAKLLDVDVDGRAINLSEGILRARFRESSEMPTPIEPGKIYRYHIELNPTANRFSAGHKIRLEISSSNFPIYDRNPNTGEAFGQSSTLKVALQTIYHGQGYPSALVLPVQPVPSTG